MNQWKLSSRGAVEKEIFLERIQIKKKKEEKNQQANSNPNPVPKFAIEFNKDQIQHIIFLLKYNFLPYLYCGP